MFFIITISSKDRKLLKKILKMFSKFNFFFINFRTISKHRSKKFLSILKSPHVNKTAQEQYEYRIYSYKCSVQVLDLYHFLVFFKKLSADVFLDVSFTLTAVQSMKCSNFSFFPSRKILISNAARLIKRYERQGGIYAHQLKNHRY